MKSSSWLTQKPLLRSFFMLTLFSMAALVSSCSEDPVDLAGRSQSAPGKLKKANAESEQTNSSKGNSTANATDYGITVTKNGKTWTYVITKKPGAKGVSHFILDLENCPGRQTLSINSIVSATVNGVAAKLESSEGNTGCDVASVTSNFVKFDDLPDASTYTIVFELDKEYGNVLETTGWIKAGTSCFSYVLNGPCCA